MYKKNNIRYTYICESFWEAHYDEEQTNNDLETKQSKTSVNHTHTRSEIWIIENIEKKMSTYSQPVQHEDSTDFSLTFAQFCSCDQIECSRTGN